MQKNNSMENLLETKVGAVVSKNYRTARIFSAYGIDFCCKGGISVAEACKVNQADAQRVLSELALIIDNEEVADPDAALHQLSNAALIELIITRHHAYVRETAPVLGDTCSKLPMCTASVTPNCFPFLQNSGSCIKPFWRIYKKKNKCSFPVWKLGKRPWKEIQPKPIRYWRQWVI